MWLMFRLKSWSLLYATCIFFFMFTTKTAYELRISDWSSDVCSSDLLGQKRRFDRLVPPVPWIVVPVFYHTHEALPFTGIGLVRSGRLVGMDSIGRASCRERVCQYV